MKIKDSSFNMTTGSPLKNILIFAIPIMMSGLIQQGYNVADTYIVGQYISADALAAVGSVGPMSSLLMGLAMGVTGGFAFEGCALESVIVPEGITAIEDSVFRSCVVLKDIKLPSTLESIGTKAFWGCESLEGIQFNEGLKVIGEDAFGAVSFIRERRDSTVVEAVFNCSTACLMMSFVNSSLGSTGTSSFDAP